MCVARKNVPCTRSWRSVAFLIILTYDVSATCQRDDTPTDGRTQIDAQVTLQNIFNPPVTELFSVDEDAAVVVKGRWVITCYYTLSEKN